MMIGTAGHIDHGKTSLVTALTGKNTDSLKEEQERGISIDIDFAPLVLTNGETVGLVDVPGHERFVRNMVAGAAGIDAALLVIDVNEGAKQQTYEHVAILEMLGIHHGVIALTKTDLVDDEWVEFAQESIREDLRDTFFATAPMVITSVKTGRGLAELKQVITELFTSMPAKDLQGAFRLPIDKVFHIPGFGTVVSGTVWRGQVHVGDTLTSMPARCEVRVRGIQVHGHAVTQATAGQRAAINITGIDYTEVKRGHTLASPGTLMESKLLDVRLQVSTSQRATLAHRQRVHVHLATGEAIGRVLLLETDEVSADQTTLAQLTLEEPLVCEPHDYFVIRNFSPVYTIGGGRILDATPARLHRRKRSYVIAELAARNDRSPEAKVSILAMRGVALTRDVVLSELGLSPEHAVELLSTLREQVEWMELPSGLYQIEYVDMKLLEFTQILRNSHEKNRLQNWLPQASLGTEMMQVFPAKDIERLIQRGILKGLWNISGSRIRQTGWCVVQTAEETKISTELVQRLSAAGMGLVSQSDLCAAFPKRDRVATSLLRYLKDIGDVVEVEAGLWMDNRSFSKGIKIIRQLFDTSGPFQVAEVRDALGVSRKTAVAVLEYMDKQKLTTRNGDHRIFTRIGQETV